MQGMKLESRCIAESEQNNAREHVLVVAPSAQGQRLDQFLATRIPSETRSRLTALIKQGLVLVDDTSRKGAFRLRGNETVRVVVPDAKPIALDAEQVDFVILHEDDDLLVLSKPPGLVVHPAAGHFHGTLVHGLLFHCRNLSGISGVERPGIVHRLDKDTSGIMVVAKNDPAHRALVVQFKERLMTKIYHALVHGCFQEQRGRVELPVGRHPIDRKKMAVREYDGRFAATSWQVLEEFGRRVSFVELRPETGRTHQLRVHMAHLGHPLLGDTVYGGRKKDPGGLMATRHLLHASTLVFQHPKTSERLEFTAPLWPDIQEALRFLRTE